MSLPTILLNVVLIGRAVFATPVEPRAVAPIALTEVGPFSHASVSILDFAGKTLVHAARATTPNTGFNALEARQSGPSGQYLYLCPTSDCASCYSFALTQFNEFTCYTFSPAPYLSVAIIKPATSDYGFSVYVGQTCTPLTAPPYAKIPAVNTCYNLNPGGVTFFLGGQCLNGCPGSKEFFLDLSMIMTLIGIGT